VLGNSSASGTARSAANEDVPLVISRGSLWTRVAGVVSTSVGDCSWHLPGATIYGLSAVARCRRGVSAAQAVGARLLIGAGLV
jgi:hypothetical protein